MQTNETFRNVFSQLPPQIANSLLNELNRKLSYTPKIGIMGKSGAGKSSLINALMGKVVCQTGNVGGCTREAQEIKIPVGNHEIIFMDLPGIAENIQRHNEYRELYAKKIQDLDIILWLIKIDDRANQNDEEFYKDLIEFYKKEHVIFVLSQSDKAHPSRDWNYQTFKPSENQLKVINENKFRIVNTFNVPENTVFPVACEYYEGRFNYYNLDGLFTEIIFSVPDEAKTGIYRAMDASHRTEKSEKETKKSFKEMVSKALDYAIDNSPLPDPIKKAAKAAKDWVVDKAEAVFDFFFG